MNSIDEKIKSVQDNLGVRVFNANYSPEQINYAQLEGRDLPRQYFFRQDLQGNYDSKLIEQIVVALINNSHLGKGTTIVVGPKSNHIKPNISARSNPWPKAVNLTDDSLDKVVELTLTHDEKRNDNVDGATWITYNQENKTYKIVSVGNLIIAEYADLTDKRKIPNSRTYWERLPFSEEVGTRNLSAFAAPHYLDKPESLKEYLIAMKDYFAEKSGLASKKYDSFSVALSSSGSIRVFSKEGIIMSSDHSEIEKSALYSNKIYAYNMTGEELENYYGPEVRAYLKPSNKLDTLKMPLIVSEKTKPLESKNKEKVLVLTA